MLILQSRYNSVLKFVTYSFPLNKHATITASLSLSFNRHFSRSEALSLSDEALPPSFFVLVISTDLTHVTMSSTPMGDAKLDSLLHSEEDLKHSEECSYWYGMCGSCQKKFDEKAKLEIEVLDDCIKGYFDAAFGPNSQGGHDSDIERLMHSLSTKAMDDLRNEWRRKFDEKFILKDNWADQDLKFWNGNHRMMKGARAVYEAAQMKRPLSDGEAEPSQDEIAEADEAIEKALLEKLDAHAEGRLKKKVKRVPRP